MEKHEYNAKWYWVKEALSQIFHLFQVLEQQQQQQQKTIYEEASGNYYWGTGLKIDWEIFCGDGNI